MIYLLQGDIWTKLWTPGLATVWRFGESSPTTRKEGQRQEPKVRNEFGVFREASAGRIEGRGGAWGNVVNTASPEGWMGYQEDFYILI